MNQKLTIHDVKDTIKTGDIFKLKTPSINDRVLLSFPIGNTELVDGRFINIDQSMLHGNPVRDIKIEPNNLFMFIKFLKFEEDLILAHFIQLETWNAFCFLLNSGYGEWVIHLEPQETP